MKIRDILTEVGRERGLVVNEEDGSLLGMIFDFPVLVRSVPYGNVRAVSITMRMGPGDFGALKKAVKGAKGMKRSMLKNPAADTVQYFIPYSSLFTGRIKGTVTTALDWLGSNARASFSAPAKACEVCHRPGVDRIVLENQRPAIICPGCMETIRVRRQTARMAYEATSPDYLKGAVMGLVGAILGAVAWALMIVLLKSTYLILTAGIGMLVAYFVKKGMGRVDRVGYVIAGLLVLASIVAGDILSYTWFIGRATGRLDVSMAYHAYMNILVNNPRNLLLTVVFALVGVWVGVLALSRMEKDTKIETVR